MRTALHLPRGGAVKLGLEADLEDPEGCGVLEEEAGRCRNLLGGRVSVSRQKEVGKEVYRILNHFYFIIYFDLLASLY